MSAMSEHPLENGTRNEIPPPVSNGVNGASSAKKPASWVPVSQQPAFSPRKLRVVCIGAGASGLILAYKYKHELHMDNFIDLVIYEKNAEIGGTWLDNKYPGVACDVPAPIYTFSWEPNPDWSSFYAGAAEILEYFKHTTRKYDLDEKVQFNRQVTSTVWDDDTGKWRVKVERVGGDGETFEDEADVVIDGSGILSKWRWPDIQGLHSFEGTLLHTARWDSGLDCTGKRIALIGNGSSAIQVLPKVQPAAARVVNYFRGPTWIVPNMLSDIAPADGDYKFSDDQKEEFRRDPQKLVDYVNGVYVTFNNYFVANVVGSPENVANEEVVRALMAERLDHDPELVARLVPEWHVGCRRLTPGDGYLEALRADNAAFKIGEVDAITEKGVVFQGQEEEFDIIVCATGFHVGFVPPWEPVGKGGVKLGEQWRESPEGYMGICAPNMPNYFTFLGPNSPVGHGSLLAVMEWAAEFMLRWCKKIASEDIKSVTVAADAVREYNVYTQEFLKGTVWAGGCRSWYKNHQKGSDTKVTAMYAGSIFHFQDMLRSFRTEDFNIEYRSANRFRFMGNGFTLRELDKGEDLTLYRVKS